MFKDKKWISNGNLIVGFLLESIWGCRYVIFTSNLHVFTIFYQLFIAPVKNDGVSKMVKMFSIFFYVILQLIENPSFKVRFLWQLFKIKIGGEQNSLCN